MFRYLVQSDMTAGNGQFRRLATILRERGYSRPAFLVDEGFSRGPLWRDTEQQLKKEFGAGFVVQLSSGAAEPTYDILRTTLQKFRGVEADVLVGVGGGSCMDTAKAVAALLTNPGDPLEYRGLRQVEGSGHPGRVGADYGRHRKRSLFQCVLRRFGRQSQDGRQWPATCSRPFSILDGETTLSCPYKAALSAGIDALVHTLEGFVCTQRNPPPPP